MSSLPLGPQVSGKSVSFGDQVLKSNILPYMRSRNVEFTCKRLKPITRVYSFFGGVDVNRFITPKLLEITMISGVFQVGETVIGNFDQIGVNLPSISFRVAQQNHKFGTYNNPSDVYTINPYNPSTNIPELYSSTSTILNVDTYSLSNQPQGSFRGYISTGMKLRGQTSKAEATVSNVRLVTDQIGVIIGSFFIPDGELDVNSRFEAGSKVFRVTSSSTNSLIYGTYSTSAEEKFVSEGKINTIQENVIVTRPLRIEVPDDGSSDPGPGNPDPDPPYPGPSPSSGGSTTAKQKTSVYYNYGEPVLRGPGANRLADLAKAAKIDPKLQASINQNMTAKQQAKVTAAINASNYANKQGIKVSTGNVSPPTPKSLPKPGGGTIKVGTAGSGAKTGGGTAAASNKNAGGGGKTGGGGGGGRGGGGKSDVRLKKNINPIDNALNKLLNI